VNNTPPCILQINGHEQWGGAEIIARSLFQAYRRRGLDSFLAVRWRSSDDLDVLEISTHKRHALWYRFWLDLERRLYNLNGRWLGNDWLRQLADKLAEPARTIDRLRGTECFRFPGTFNLLDLPPKRPDIVHCHNLHGDYFDLRALPWLSQKVPFFITLHDNWLLSGHCSQSFDCNRWITGCGECPDLTIYPDLRRDGTAHNWQRKKTIYDQSRLYVATPSKWLMNRVRQSMLTPAIIDARVIHNGVDLSVFKPGNKYQARHELSIPQKVKIMLGVANGMRRNQFRNYRMMSKAAGIVAEKLESSQVMLLILGEYAEVQQIGRCQLRFAPFESNPEVVVKYYQAADLYLHAARADTFPTTVLEALACGTPTVATAVGGIPEQIMGLHLPEAAKQFPRYTAAEATGVLVNPGDAHGMARSAVTLMNQAELYKRVANNAVKDAQQRFNLNRQCDEYLDWYNTILSQKDKYKTELK
jgi:glycosyltransferase involved in cell wall biosynthesis